MENMADLFSFLRGTSQQPPNPEVFLLGTLGLFRLLSSSRGFGLKAMHSFVSFGLMSLGFLLMDLASTFTLIISESPVDCGMYLLEGLMLIFDRKSVFQVDVFRRFMTWIDS